MSRLEDNSPHLSELAFCASVRTLQAFLFLFPIISLISILSDLLLL